MKFPAPIPVKDIAKKIGASDIIGDQNQMATGINEIHKVEPGDIMFCDLKKYFKQSLASPASLIILNKKVDCPKGKTLLIHEAPFKAYDKLVREFRPFRPLSAQIADSAQIHPSAIIEPNLVIGPNVIIGKQSYIQANVVIHEHTRIGSYVKIQSGTIIGTDAFYFKKERDKTYTKWRSGGSVIIHNHVDIGANCTINRGVSGDTIIGEGTKIDCLVHVGHGAEIGKNCLIAGQVGIGGKTIIEDNCVLYGQVGLAQSIRIGKGALIGAKSGVSKDLPGGKIYFGYPADEIRTKQRELAALRHLPDFYKQFYE